MIIKYAYLRVSTEEQNLERQFKALEKYEIPKQNVFYDMYTGKTMDRPQYSALKTILINISKINEQRDEKKDIIELYIKELDRLGRNKKLILEEMRWFAENGIKLRIEEIPTTLVDISDTNAWVLDMVNNIMIEVMAVFAEEELKKRAMRQKEGIEIAKKNNKYKGRKPIQIDMDLFKEVYKEWRIEKRITAREGMDRLNLKPNTFYRTVKKYEENPTNILAKI